MKFKNKHEVLRFSLSLLHYDNSYYIDRVTDLEKALARKPHRLQIDMLGEGEIPADWALLIRSILRQRPAKTWLITNARSSLQNGSVLVWLIGDERIIRDDARLFFRRSDGFKDEEKAWAEGDAKSFESDDEMILEEADHAKVLHLINEFLPVNELAGKPIEVPVLRQFGLVENEKFDDFLATAFSRLQSTIKGQATKQKRPRAKPNAARKFQTKKQAKDNRGRRRMPPPAHLKNPMPPWW